MIARKRVRLQEDTGEVSLKSLNSIMFHLHTMIEPNDLHSLQSQVLKLKQKNKSLQEKCNQLRTLEQRGSSESSSSNGTEEALISQYEVSPSNVYLRKLMFLQHKLSLAKHAKDEAVEALRSAEVRPGYMYVLETQITLLRDLIGRSTPDLPAEGCSREHKCSDSSQS